MSCVRKNNQPSPFEPSKFNKVFDLMAGNIMTKPLLDFWRLKKK